MSTWQGAVYLGIFDVGHALSWAEEHKENQANGTDSSQRAEDYIPSLHINLGLALELDKYEKIAEKHAAKRKQSIKIGVLKRSNIAVIDFK